MLCVDLEKAYDRVPREQVWCCMEQLRVAEKYVRVLQDNYDASKKVVSCALGKWVSGRGGVESGITSEPHFVCYVDRKVDR